MKKIIKNKKLHAYLIAMIVVLSFSLVCFGFATAIYVAKKTNTNKIETNLIANLTSIIVDNIEDEEINVGWSDIISFNVCNNDGNLNSKYGIYLETTKYEALSDDFIYSICYENGDCLIKDKRLPMTSIKLTDNLINSNECQNLEFIVKYVGEDKTNKLTTSIVIK